VNALRLLGGVRKHFFPEFNTRLDGLSDPRNADMTSYSLRHLAWSGLLMMLEGVGSRFQHISETAEDTFLSSLLWLTGTVEEDAAHPGTLNYLLMRMPPSQLLNFNADLLRRLLRMRCLERYRFGGEWLVAVDATELQTYSKPHCSKCLRRKLSNGQYQYFHAILEAKLILGNGMVISICSIPILNSRRGYRKQDCELKAFHRLAPEMKRRFPKLPICLVMDSLYGCEPVFRLCRKMNWSHVTVFKKGRTPALWRRTLEARDRHPEQTKTIRLKNGTVQTFSWATGLKHGRETVHAIFCDERNRNGKLRHWGWLTDHRPEKHNVHILANKGARLRWKIENEGFNVQKNGEIRLEHDYGSQGHAWYNYYLLGQTAHLLQQLCWFGDLVTKLSKGYHKNMTKAFRTLRNFAARLRQAVLAGGPVSTQDDTTPAAIQIRLNTS
jgi:hypothetical protein